MKLSIIISKLIFSIIFCIIFLLPYIIPDITYDFDAYLICGMLGWFIIAVEAFIEFILNIQE
jgi:hypothetical protein